MININRFLQKSYELQQKQYELDLLNSQTSSQETVHVSVRRGENIQQYEKANNNLFENENRVTHSFPLKIHFLQSTEQNICEPAQFGNYSSPQAQSQASNMMASSAQFTFRNQTGSQNKIQNPSVQYPIAPIQSFSENSIQNNIIMNNLMTQSNQNYNKGKQHTQACPHEFQIVQNIEYEELEQEDNYTPISYNISSNLKWDYTASKTSQLQASSLQSQCIVDESAFSKQQINTPLLNEIPHYPMIERASLEFNCNRLSEIPKKNLDQSFESKYQINSPLLPVSTGYSPSKISDLSCLRIENMNPQYIANNVLITHNWENNPLSANLTMNTSINNGGDRAMNLHLNLNLNNNKQQCNEPNNRYNHIESSQEQEIFDQVVGENLTSHIVKNFESMESSISYNHSVSIMSDALQDNPKKNNSLKQELEHIINSTRENTNQSAPSTEFNSNQFPVECKKEEFLQPKNELNFYQQSSSVSSHMSSQSQVQEAKNQFNSKQDPKHLKQIKLNSNIQQLSDSDKENEEINYTYEPKSNRNYQVSVSTASSSDQFTHRQKQDTLRKLLSPQGHQELMSQFLGSSQTLSHFDNNKQQLLPTEEFFIKSKQQLDSTRNNPNAILNILNRSRDTSPLNGNSSSKKVGINLSLTNLNQMIQSTRNTQTKSINLNYTPTNQQQSSDRKQKIPKLSINISQVMDLKSSQTDFGKSSISPNRLGQSQSTKNILQKNRSGSNLRGVKSGCDGEELKMLYANNTSRNKCISINIAQMNTNQVSSAATTTNSKQGNSNPQLFKRLNNKSMTNVSQQTAPLAAMTTKTNSSISPTRRLQIQLSSIVQPVQCKNISISPNSLNQNSFQNKLNNSSKLITPKNSDSNQSNLLLNSQNQATSPQRDNLKQYHLVYKPEKKQDNTQMRRSNTQRCLLNSSNNFNSYLNNSKNNNTNNNQSSFLNKSNELIKKNAQLIQQKAPSTNVNVPITNMDSKLEKFYKTNQKQIESIQSKNGLKHLLSDRNQHKSINLNHSNQNNNSNYTQRNISSSQIPQTNNEDINQELRIQEKLFEENCQSLKFSGIQLGQQQRQQSQNTQQTPISQNSKQIQQKCLHSLPQIYCNICNRKSRNNIQQLLSKR